MKKVLFMLLAVVVLASCSFALADDKYARITKYSDAYLEPEEDELFYAGRFSISGAVRVIRDVSDEWSEIEYMFSQDNADPEPRRVYVKTSALIPWESYENDTPDINKIVSPSAASAQEQPSTFDESLLVDMNYVPQRSRESALEVSCTNRTKTVGEGSDFRDALTVQTGSTYSGGTRIVFTPDVKINGETQYPIDANAINLLVSENKTYRIDNVYITDKKVIAGLRFILENSPPYKVYTSYPSDYVEASRTASALAIRAFMKDTLSQDDWLDIYSGIVPYDINAFSLDYMGYMYWLYKNAMIRYSEYEDVESPYLSTDIQGEPTESNGIFLFDVRVTTNAEGGWKIDKKSLSANVTDIKNAEENENYYMGSNGTRIITVEIREDAAGEEIELPILFNSDNEDGPALQIKTPEEDGNPVLVSLSSQNESNPARILRIQMPSASRVTFTSVQKENEQPLANVSITITSDKGRKYYLTSDESGIADCVLFPGKYTYSVVNTPEGFEASEHGSLNVTADQNITLAFTEKTYTLHVRIEDLVTKELIQQKAEVSLYTPGNTSEPLWNGTTETGEIVIDGLKAGRYLVHQDTELSKHEAASDVTVLLGKGNNTCVISNPPLSGYLAIYAYRVKTEAAVEGLEVNVYNSDNTLVETLVTDSTGNAISKRIPAGTYTVVASRTPDGFTVRDETALKRTETVKYNKTTASKWGLIRKQYNISIYVREQSGIDKFNAYETPRESGMCDLNGSVFQLIAAEPIQGNLQSYSTGDVVFTFPEISSKNAFTSGNIIFPGKYILHESKSSPGYKPAEDMEIQITKNKNSYEFHVLKTPFTSSITITDNDADGKAKAGIVYRLYSAKYYSYDMARAGYRYTVETDENGKAVIDGVCYGKWILTRVGETKKEKSHNTSFEILAPGIIEFRYVNGIPGSTVRVDVTDSRGQAVSTSAFYQVYSSDGTLIQSGTENSQIEIIGSGTLPMTLQEGDYILKEVTPPEGFESSSDIPFSVKNESDAVSVTVTHSPQKKSLAVRVLIPEFGEPAEYSYNDAQYRTVQYKTNYRPVENVSVIGLTAPFHTAFRVKTIQDGNIITPPIDVGTYYILAGDIPQGYTAANLPEKINTSQGTEKLAYVDIRLALKPSAILFYLHDASQEGENGSIYGLYAGLLGTAPIDGGQAPMAIQRAKNGMVSFFGEYPPGDYYVAPVADMDGTPQADACTPVHITAPGTCVSIDEKDPSIFEIKAGVIDSETQSPISDAYITLSDISGEIYSGYTDEAQNFIDLKPGTYYIRTILAPEGYAINPNTYTFDVKDDGSVTGTAYVPLKPVCIQIKVQDTNGPVKGSTLAMRNLDSGMQYTARSGDDGIARFTGVQYGNYEIAECFPADGYQMSSTVVRLKIDGLYQNAETPSATLNTIPNSLYCAVYATDGEPIRSAGIELVNNYGNILECVVTNENGAAFFNGIPFGSYKVRLRDVPGEFLRPDYEYTLVVGNKTRGCINKQFVFACHRKIMEYRLSVGKENMPVYGAEFAMVRKDDASIVERAKTDSDGRFAFDEFDYGVYVIREVYAPEGTAKVEDIEIAIDSEWAREPEKQLKTAYNYFALECYDNKGHPLPGVFFTMRNTDTGEKISGGSDGEGNVRFNHLKLGTYEVTVAIAPEAYVPSDEKLTVLLTESYSPAETPYRVIIKAKESE